MDPQEYRDARWHALLREAAALGVPDEEAPALVQRVLDQHQRTIRRAEDPDPLVRQALGDTVHPPARRPPARRRGLAVLAVGLAVVGGLAWLNRPADPPTDRLGEDQVPSLFGYEVDDARALLEDRGFTVTVRPWRACEVLDRVVTSDPAAGAEIEDGEQVVVFSAVPADVTCLTDYPDREAAWQLLDFANGRGPAPAFADRVLVRAGDAPAVVLDGRAASEPEAWTATGVLEGLREATAQVSLVTEWPPRYAVPVVRIVPAHDRTGRCGAPSPSVAGGADAFSMVVRLPDVDDCGVRLDVSRADGAIEAIAYYPD